LTPDLTPSRQKNAPRTPSEPANAPPHPHGYTGRRYSYHRLVLGLGVPLALIGGLWLLPKVSAVLAIAILLFLFFAEPR
jgi:hypothetical protein